MSNSNAIRVSIIEESTFGTTPSTPAFLVLPTTGQSLRDLIGQQTDPTISADRNLLDLIPISKATGGALPCVMRYSVPTEALGQILRAIIATETADVEAEIAVASCTVTSGNATIVRGSGSFITDGFEVGDIVKVTGAASATLDDGYYLVTAVVALTLTLDGASWSGDDAAVTVTRAERMKNGTKQRSFSIEVARTDLDVAVIWTGCTFNDMDLTIADEALSTVTFTVRGKSSTYVSTPVSGTGTSALYVTGATYTDPTVYPALTSTIVPEFNVGGSAYAAKSINLRFTNNVEAQTQVGSEGPQSMRYGSYGAQITFSAYMDGHTDFNRHTGNTATNLWIVQVDSSGRGWSHQFGTVKFSDLTADTQGLNQTDYKNGTMVALKDATQLCTHRMQRWIA